MPALERAKEHVMLRDVISHMGLSFFAEAALVLFFVVFVVVSVVAMRGSRRSASQMAMMPLREGDGSPANDAGAMGREVNRG
ncbi:MAG: hypothetical protein RBS39_10205 [Phycisphaerales bacterium]|nr:hypothetical protein [Phycisphaerales bacterium]